MYESLPESLWSEQAHEVKRRRLLFRRDSGKHGKEKSYSMPGTADTHVVSKADVAASHSICQ